MKGNPPNRHLSRAALQEYLVKAAPATIVIPGDPTCRIVIDPTRREMVLRTSYHGRGREVDVAEFEHLNVRVVSSDGISWCDLVVAYHDSGHEAYLMLSDLADLIQLEHLPFDAAVRAILKTFEHLLVRAGGLSAERQTGLYGELLFLESAMRAMSIDLAIGSWKGYTGHEHDFVVPGACFEIKTTRTEKRQHRIGSLEQLDPIPGSPLWLISVQVTSAAPGCGRTLGELVDDIREYAGPSRPKLNMALTQVGWRECDRPWSSTATRISRRISRRWTSTATTFENSRRGRET